LSCPAADVDRHLDAGLRRIVEVLGADRATIWALDDGSGEARRLTHSWTREAVPSPRRAILERDAPRVFSRLRQGAVVRIGQFGVRPDEALIDRETLAQFGTRSSAVVPLLEGDVVVGGLSVGMIVEERDWPDELIARLRLLADVIANALARQRAARAAHERAEQIRDLAGRLMSSQEDERRRIARELHDGVNQDLAALAIALNALEDGLPEGTAPERRQEVARLQGRIVELTEAIRHLSHELHPGILQYGGLAAALRSHCREFEREHGLTVALRVGDDLETVPPDVALCLYRVTQEALKNAARHAKPSRAWVALARDGAELVLTIGDDGAGFDLAQARIGGGLGLISLDERVRLVRGRLAIETQPRRGTQIRVAVPLPEARGAPPDDTAR
jgi:signal transduction histidine kinase